MQGQVVLWWRKHFPTLTQMRFIRLWTQTLSTDAKVFAGLYSGLWTTFQGENKHPERTLGEWLMRTKNKWDDAPVAKLSEDLLNHAMEHKDDEECALYAGWLLKACEKAGINKEEQDNIVLTEDTVNAYINWEGETMYPGDRVRVINPAWYQNGTILDQGHCTLKEREE